MSIDVVIVNWNSGTQLRTCVESVLAFGDGLIGNIIIVDNGSADGSLDRLISFTFPLKIIRNTENKGFAAACNQGARNSRADYLLFLNPDTRLFPNSLTKPLAFMETAQNKSVGICGIQLLDDSGYVSRSCTRFPTPRMFYSRILGLTRLFPGFFSDHFMAEWEHDENREVDHVIGAFYMVRRQLFEQLGGFDERFFVYLEDLDFSYRANKSGWKSYYLAEAQAYHKGGGTSEQVKAKRLFYSLRSRILYGYKHFSRTQATMLLLATLLLEPLARLALNAFKRSSIDARETISGYWMLYSALPEMIAVAWKG